MNQQELLNLLGGIGMPVSKIEKELKMPASTLAKAIKNERNLPTKWNEPLTTFIKTRKFLNQAAETGKPIIFKKGKLVGKDKNIVQILESDIITQPILHTTIDGEDSWLTVTKYHAENGERLDKWCVDNKISIEDFFVWMRTTERRLMWQGRLERINLTPKIMNRIRRKDILVPATARIYLTKKMVLRFKIKTQKMNIENNIPALCFSILFLSIFAVIGAALFFASALVLNYIPKEVFNIDPGYLYYSLTSIFHIGFSIVYGMILTFKFLSGIDIIKK